VSWPVFALIIVTVVVLVLWLVRSRASIERARRLEDGTQEARVVVDRGYVPSRISLEAGVPTTLHFERREDDPCTEMLVSELWPNAHRLVAHGDTAIHFTPDRLGRFAFTCGMGMYSGELIVHGTGKT
jgi:plastocyanin domain-containing protein